MLETLVYRKSILTKFNNKDVVIHLFTEKEYEQIPISVLQIPEGIFDSIINKMDNVISMNRFSSKDIPNPIYIVTDFI